MSTNNMQSAIRDKAIEHLNEMLSAENAAIDRVQSRIQECIIPEGKQRLEQHLEETRAQQDRLRQIITSIGGDPTDSKADLPNLRPPATMLAKKTLTNMAKSVTGKGDTNPMHEEIEMLRNKEDYGIENIEILGYRMLIRMCEKTGIQSAPPLLQQSLQEEESMAEWIETNSPMVFDILWPRIEAAVTGTGKEHAATTSRTV